MGQHPSLPSWNTYLQQLGVNTQPCIRNIWGDRIHRTVMPILLGSVITMVICAPMTVQAYTPSGTLNATGWYIDAITNILIMAIIAMALVRWIQHTAVTLYLRRQLNGTWESRIQPEIDAAHQQYQYILKIAPLSAPNDAALTDIHTTMKRIEGRQVYTSRGFCRWSTWSSPPTFLVARAKMQAWLARHDAPEALTDIVPFPPAKHTGWFRRSTPR